MNRTQDMAMAFVAAYPEDAARTLALVPSTEAAAFLDQAPAEVSAAVLASMPPIAAAQCLEVCDDPTAARLLEGLAPLPGKVILSHLPADRQVSLLQLLPKSKAAGIRQLLEHPENTVGARVDYQVVALPGTNTAYEALAHLGTRVLGYAGDVFVLGADRRILGEIPVGRLLAGPKDTLLSALAMPCPRVLNSLTPLTSVVDLNEWETHDVLPVVDREQRFLGILHHAALARRAGGHLARHSSSVFGSLVAGMADAYWNGAATVIAVLVPEGPGTARDPDRGSRHET